MMKPALLLTALLTTGMAAAAGFQPFDAAQFEAARRAGKPVLVDVHAEWCPVCRRQAKLLAPLLQEKPFADITAFKLDFDAQKAQLAPLQVRSQSTLILYHQGQEVRRSVGETRPQALRQFLLLPR